GPQTRHQVWNASVGPYGSSGRRCSSFGWQGPPFEGGGCGGPRGLPPPPSARVSDPAGRLTVPGPSGGLTVARRAGADTRAQQVRNGPFFATSMKTYLAVLFVVVSALGCNGSEECHVDGFVCTRVDVVVAQSSLALGIHKDERYRRIPAARILLTVDREKQIVIAEAMSEQDGTYRLDVKRLPRPTDPAGYYYLVVQHDKYEELISPVIVASRSRYLENTVILKPNDRDR